MLKNINLLKNQSNQLPNNIDAEQSLIGSILLNNEILIYKNVLNLILMLFMFFNKIVINLNFT